MKKIILVIITIIAILYLISEQEVYTSGIILLKAMSLFWIWLIAKANNYFYQGE